MFSFPCFGGSTHLVDRGKNMRRINKILIVSGALAVAAAAFAAETITYKYDARGRLVKVERTGTVNNGVNTSYTYDKSDNRTNKTTTGVP